MAKECIQNCPVIKEIKESISNRNMFSGPLAFHPDSFMGSNTDRILTACEASYSCSGPQTKEEEVEKCIFRTRIEIETVEVCGLEK